MISTDEVEDVPAKVKEITGGKLAYAVRRPALYAPLSDHTCCYGHTCHHQQQHHTMLPLQSWVLVWVLVCPCERMSCGTWPACDQVIPSCSS